MPKDNSKSGGGDGGPKPPKSGKPERFTEGEALPVINVTAPMPQVKPSKPASTPPATPIQPSESSGSGENTSGGGAV